LKHIEFIEVGLQRRAWWLIVRADAFRLKGLGLESRSSRRV